MNKTYRLNEKDTEVLAAIGHLLKRLAASESIRPAQLVTIAKVQHVLSRLPRVTEGVCATIEISHRINQEGCSSSSIWHFFAGDGQLALSCGGSEYTESVGSDSFTTMTWEAQPGEQTDYDGSWDDSWMERECEGYSDSASCGNSFEDCEISIDDDDNPFLFESEEADGDDDATSDNLAEE
jgi:hypothetical protein